MSGLQGLVLEGCCCALYHPWKKGMSNEYDCPAEVGGSMYALGNDFLTSKYNAFDNGECGGTPNCLDDPECFEFGQEPYMETNYSAEQSSCARYPFASWDCCCGVNCVMFNSIAGGYQCSWAGLSDNNVGEKFLNYQTICTKFGAFFVSLSCEDERNVLCCEQEAAGDCDFPACGCEQEFGDTDCVSSQEWDERVDYCNEEGDQCDTQNSQEYSHIEPYDTEGTPVPTVLHEYVGFEKTTTLDICPMDEDDPWGDHESALVIEATGGATLTARVVLRGHLVDSTNDPIDYPDILDPFFNVAPGTFSTPPDDDTNGGGCNNPTQCFPYGIYSPQPFNSLGNMYWVTITITMTSGAYNGQSWDYHGYGTAEHFKSWAMSNIPAVTDGTVVITASNKYWMGLRIGVDSLNQQTGQYTPSHEYRRIMTGDQPEYIIAPTLGYMPHNSDDYILYSTTTTRVEWKARFRYFYRYSILVEKTNRVGGGREATLECEVVATCLNPPTSACLDNNSPSCNQPYCIKDILVMGDGDINSGGTGTPPTPCSPAGTDTTSGTCNQFRSGGACDLPRPLNRCYETVSTTHNVTCDPNPCAWIEDGAGAEASCWAIVFSDIRPSRYDEPMEFALKEECSTMECPTGCAAVY